MISFTLDGNSIETAPEKGAYDVSITCNNGAEGYWDYEEWGPNIRNITTKTKCSIAFTTGKYFSEYIISLSNSNVSNVEKMEHVATAQTPSLTDYRYVGKDPNNYVYFGCDTNCTEDNLYRIIGVIPTQSSNNGEYEQRVKLIKANYYTETESGYLKPNTSSMTPSGYGYDWNSITSSNWEASTLQKYVLNGVYWNSLGKYQKYIASSLWYLGAFFSGKANTNTSNYYYLSERSNIQGYSKGATNYVATIGLMYPSDWGYSIGSSYQNEQIYLYRNLYKTEAWLEISENKYGEWSISPTAMTGDSYAPYINIIRYGYIYSGPSSRNDNSHTFSIRPTFYLKADVKYASGDGTIDNPYRIAL